MSTTRLHRTDDGRRVLVAPIPLRDFDYCATFDGYEPGEPQGFGRTPDRAIDALLEDERRMQETTTGGNH